MNYPRNNKSAPRKPSKMLIYGVATASHLRYNLKYFSYSMHPTNSNIIPEFHIRIMLRQQSKQNQPSLISNSVIDSTSRSQQLLSLPGFTSNLAESLNFQLASLLLAGSHPLTLLGSSISSLTAGRHFLGNNFSVPVTLEVSLLQSTDGLFFGTVRDH